MSEPTHVKQIQSHSHLNISGTLLDPHAATKIIFFCATSDHGDLNHTYKNFHHLPNPFKLIWNTVVRAFAEKNEPVKSVYLYKNMLDIGFLPNNYTFSFLLRACAHLSDISLGKILHAQIVRLGWESYEFVQNGLIHLYATCDCMNLAWKLFDASVNQDVIMWAALIIGYVKSGLVVAARKLFDQMPMKNTVSWSAMMGCSKRLWSFLMICRFLGFGQIMLALLVHSLCVLVLAHWIREGGYKHMWI